MHHGQQYVLYCSSCCRHNPLWVHDNHRLPASQAWKTGIGQMQSHNDQLWHWPDFFRYIYASAHYPTIVGKILVRAQKWGAHRHVVRCPAMTAVTTSQPLNIKCINVCAWLLAQSSSIALCTAFFNAIAKASFATDKGVCSSLLAACKIWQVAGRSALDLSAAVALVTAYKVRRDTWLTKLSSLLQGFWGYAFPRNRQMFRDGTNI